MDGSRTTYVLLGFLTWRPMSGYELKQNIARSVGNFWSEGDGQIYPVLQRLASRGWVSSHKADEKGGRRRRVHEITDAGRDALREWLCAPVTEPPPRIELLLKLFFGSEVPAPVSLTHIEAARTAAIYRIAHLQTIADDLRTRDGDDPRQEFWLLTVDYGLEVTRARLRWCDRTIVALGRLTGSDRGGRHADLAPGTASGTDSQQT